MFNKKIAVAALVLGGVAISHISVASAEQIKSQQWATQAANASMGGSVTAQSVSDYFSTEIMRPLNPAEQEMLMRTALLPSVSEPLAVALCNSEAVVPLLQKLHRRRLFTDRQVGGEQRYRFHDMFREYLWTRLRDALPATEWTRTLAKAAQVAAQASEVEIAIPLALESGDVDAAAALIGTLARGLLGTGRFQTLHDWIARLGSCALEDRPQLRYWLGRAQMHMNVAVARTSLETAYGEFVGLDDRSGQLLAAVQVCHTYNYEYLDYSLVTPWIQRIDGLVAHGHVSMEVADEAELCTARLLTVTWTGHVNLDTLTHRSEFLVMHSTLDSSSRIRLGVALADVFTVSARMADSRRIIDTILPLMEDQGVTAFTRIYALLQIGYHMMRAGEDQSALEAWDRLDRDAHTHGMRQMEFTSRVFRSLLFSGRGNVRESQALLTGLEAHAGDDKPLFSALLYVALALMEIARGDGSSAASYARISMRHADRWEAGSSDPPGVHTVPPPSPWQATTPRRSATSRKVYGSRPRDGVPVTSQTSSCPWRIRSCSEARRIVPMPPSKGCCSLPVRTTGGTT